ncbi:MAG: asparagine--tRNA ligase [Planctomycetota bacterium]|nr:asparagine--tRNA ligase [Planctomycetota bacterium]
MSTRVRISELPHHVGEVVQLLGWVRFRRSSGTKLHFLQLRDGSGFVQAVVKKGNVPEEVLDAAGKVPLESAVSITGTVREDARQVGGVEVTVDGVDVLAPCVDDFPIGKKEHGVGFLMDNRHLWLRSSRPWATLRIRAEIIRACREHLDEQGFVCVDAPIFNSAAAEGTATLFPVEYFGDTVYLSQTGQLHMEAAAQALGKVYCFGPTFRAEKSKTRRHLTEFWMLEPEMAFADLDDSMALMESMIAHVVARVLENRKSELELLERDVSKLEPATRLPYPRVSYDDAVKQLEGTEHAIEWGDDFGAPQEDAVSSGHDQPVLIHRFPMQIKAFYMQADPERPELALGCDLIAPEGYGEIIGGGERSPDLEYLIRKIEEEGLPQEAYEWYLDLRRYGACQSAGFGMGLERVVAWLSGIPHIREGAPFARTMARTAP